MLIPTPDNSKNVSDMRLDPIGLLKSVEKSNGPQYIFYRSLPKAVLLNISDFQKIIDLLEDYIDSLSAKKFEQKDKKKISWFNQKKVNKLLSR